MVRLLLLLTATTETGKTTFTDRNKTLFPTASTSVSPSGTPSLPYFSSDSLTQLLKRNSTNASPNFKSAKFSLFINSDFRMFWKRSSDIKPIGLFQSKTALTQLAMPPTSTKSWPV